MPTYTVDSVTTTTLGVKVCVLIFITNNHELVLCLIDDFSVQLNQRCELYVCAINIH